MYNCPTDIISFVDYMSKRHRNMSLVLSEAEMNKHLKVKILDYEDYIKKNNVEEVSDPLLFIRDNMPAPKGLLSNEIFGITKDDRSNIFAYIDLGGWYLHPFIYKVWSSMDKNIREIVHGTKNFRLDENGMIVEDPNGKTGVEFLRKNINKIRIKETNSQQRKDKIQFIYNNKNKMFLNKFLVIPAFYRDVNTSSHIGVGSLNKYYQSLIISAQSIKETQDYGLSIESSIAGRIQETLLLISNCIFGTSKNKDDGIGLSGKTGYIRSGVMSKSTDYGTRLVLSAPELKVETLDDMMIDFEHAGLPLASACVNFHPFILFHVKRYFENQFNGSNVQYYYNREKKELVPFEIKDPQIQFSDEVIESHLHRFIYGYSNRLEPIRLRLEDGKVISPVFKGHYITKEKFAKAQENPEVLSGDTGIANRRLTWCDVFYMAACEACRDKHVLITRYPMDSYFNQFPIKVRITSTKETEHVELNDIYYPFYPKIRESDIGKNTSNSFIDTLIFSNLYLKAIGGDYDGDQASVKAVWSVEANEELDKKVKSISNFIDLGGVNIRVSSNEAIQSLYNLTKILTVDNNKLINPIF